MKKIIIIALTLIMSSFIAFGQSSTEAKSILDKTYNAYLKSNGIQLNFDIVTTDSKGNNTYNEKGVAKIKGNSFTLNTDNVNAWFNGTTQWWMFKESNEVNISNPSNQDLTASPTGWLSLYKTGFTLKKPVIKTINGKNAYVINMTPNTQNSDFKEATLAVDKNNNTLLQIVLKLKDNSVAKINISNYNSNYKFNDSTFIFNKSDYPGVEIIDLR
ncbi:MAG: LolA-like putative outer membrane lipoprotein chaperone [Dysgonamonadaceae bacterium]